MQATEGGSLSLQPSCNTACLMLITIQWSTVISTMMPNVILALPSNLFSTKYLICHLNISMRDKPVSNMPET